jgi:4-diphosphocytidyl-2-C-methyl-D-erythritol kinase
MDSLTLESFAKVNIGLKVLNRRRDGYHNIATLFQELGFHDTLTIEKQPSGCGISTDVDWVPRDESNLAAVAYNVFKEQFPEIAGVQIDIKKRIPVGAGMGGGSSNGAAVLKGLNELFELNLTSADLEQYAMQVGADVPFFISGGTQIGEKRGEVLTPLKHAVGGRFLCIIPEISISTQWAYGVLKKYLKADDKQPNFAHFIKGDFTLNELFDNDFEKAVIPAYPEIGELKTRLIEAGAGYASLSGSGSTVFGIFSDEAQAQRAALSFPPQVKTIITQPTNS